MDTSLYETFTGEENGDQFGLAVAGAGDVDNDGFDDIIIGAWNWTDTTLSGSWHGKVYIYGSDGIIGIKENIDTQPPSLRMEIEQNPLSGDVIILRVQIALML